MLPMNCRITPRPPLRETEPVVGVRSPAMILSRVVLPDPLGPTRATMEPSPTPERHVVEQHPPVGQVIPDAGKFDVPHGRPC